MVYRVIGLMSGSSMDGLDIAYVHLQETSGKWNFEIKNTACYPYNKEWATKLRTAATLPALGYQLLHAAYGRWLGEQVNAFITVNNLHFQVQLIASHGHTTFHLPERGMTAQLGDGAALAATTGINVVSDLRAMDIGLGGQGAPIVPIGEKLLFPEYNFFLNLGGIANFSCNKDGRFTAYDVCPANRVLNMLASEAGKEYDNGGEMAYAGTINETLLTALNALPYYKRAYPKSLPNEFGTDTVYPMIKNAGCGTADGLRTYIEHIAIQTAKAINEMRRPLSYIDGIIEHLPEKNINMLVTGGGAFNIFLLERLKHALSALKTELIIPAENMVQYKEALVMALIGILRWREENNVMASVTGASRNSIGGAVWIGQEA